MENLLRTWKKDPSCSQVVISYGVNFETKGAWAVIRKTKDSNPIEINMPGRPSPFKTWREWFSGYFEPQMKLLLDEVGLDGRVTGNKGHLLKLLERERDFGD